MYIILVICGWVPIAGVKLDFLVFFKKWHILFFPPFSLIFLCNIYSLKIQTINNCSKVMGKQTCALSTSFHVMMLKPVQAGKKQKNKQISWN